MKVSLQYFEEVLESVSKWEAKDQKAAQELVKKYLPGTKLIDKRAAAALLSCSLRQVDYLRENYGLPWIRLGELVKFDRDQVQEWLEGQKYSGAGSVPCLAKAPK